MEIWQTLQEELNRLYEMFVQRNPYFEAKGGKVSIVAHSLGCVVTYDILTGWTQDVEHSWYNLQTRGGGVQDLKRSRRFRAPNSAGVLGGGPGGGGGLPGGGRGPGGGPIGAEQSGLLFRIENFFCLGSPLSVFLTLRWRDPTNQVRIAWGMEVFPTTFPVATPLSCPSDQSCQVGDFSILRDLDGNPASEHLLATDSVLKNSIFSFPISCLHSILPFSP